MKKIFTFYSVILITSCTSSTKPSEEVMQQCLVQELGSSVKISAFQFQDGVSKEIDGVNYYDAYFNAETKFINDQGRFKVGDEYKMVKVGLSLMKTEKGWNCQEFNWGSAKFVKIGGTNNANTSSQEMNKNEFSAAMNEVNQAKQEYENAAQEYKNEAERLREEQKRIQQSQQDSEYNYVIGLAKRIYFHDAPNHNAKREGVYFIKDQKAKYRTKDRNIHSDFLYVDFYYKGKTTSGYILKSEVKFE